MRDAGAQRKRLARSAEGFQRIRQEGDGMMRVAVAGAPPPAVAAGTFAGGRRRALASGRASRGFAGRGARRVVAVVRASSSDDARDAPVDAATSTAAAAEAAAPGRTTGSGAPLPAGYDSARARAGLLAQISEAKTTDEKTKTKTKSRKSGKKGSAAATGNEKTATARRAKASAARRAKKAPPKKKALTDLPLTHPDRKPWTPYPWDKPGVAGYEPKDISELKYTINGNALMQIDRQTIPYNQFVRDLTARPPTIRELWWQREALDRYMIVYTDDRVAYVQVPVDEWKTGELILRAGIEIQEITDESESDATNAGVELGAADSGAKLFTNYGVPLIGVGIVWFIVWTMNRFKGDFDDRQKMMEIERREEAMKKVESDMSLKLLQQKLDLVDKEKDPEGWNQAKKELDVRRAKLQARARFFISEEGGGPGGGSTGGGDQADAADKFMKLGSMKVIGKRDAGGDGDAVKEAMEAARRAKEDDEKKREEKAARMAEQAAMDGSVDLSEIDKKAEEEVEKSQRRMKQGQLRSKMKMRDESQVVKFSDVAGIGDAKIELAEIVDFFRKPEKFKASGAKVPKGVMLTGPPGCGKTLLARAVAGESGATFFSLTASEFVEMFVGVGAARVRDLFSQAKKQAPSIIFIDELDAIGRPRGAGGSGNDERDQTLNQLLVELDGFGSDSGVVCIAATNRIDVLDKALVRAGRFDRKITVQPPTREGRLQILKVHVRGKPLADDVDLEDLAYEMNGFTGAIIANVVNTACLAAAREGRDDICQANFDAAVEAEQLGKILPVYRGEENERRIARVHAGCAVATAILLRDVCKVNFATITPRETNMDGCVALKDFPEVERPNAMTRAIIQRHLRSCFVPQLAEEEHYGFDDLSAAAAPYTARAREIAAMMVTAAGMSFDGSQLNYVPTVDQYEVKDFLRTEAVEMLIRSTTPDKYYQSDIEAREMMEMEHRAARRFVRRQKAAIDAVTAALVEHKTVDWDMMSGILEEHAVPEPEFEEEIGKVWVSPEDRERLVPSTREMPEGAVPATNEWIET